MPRDQCTWQRSVSVTIRCVSLLRFDRSTCDGRSIWRRVGLGGHRSLLAGECDVRVEETANHTAWHTLTVWQAISQLHHTTNFLCSSLVSDSAVQLTHRKRKYWVQHGVRMLKQMYTAASLYPPCFVTSRSTGISHHQPLWNRKTEV